MQVFQPNLTLILHPDGLYSVDSVTLTPSSCFSAGRARRGSPPQLRFGPEIEPLMLDIKVREGMCLQVITPLKHRVQGIALGGKSGKTTITACALVDSRVVGQNSVSLSAGSVSLGLSQKSVPIDTSDWYAWTQRTPPLRLHVKGSVYVPTPGYEASLQPDASAPKSPEELCLDLKISEKPGNWPEIITCLAVRYEIDIAASHWDRVRVGWPSGSAELEVDEVA